MVYSIQYIASESKLERLFELLYGIQVKWNRFELNEKKFTIYSYLSKANVDARMYHYSYDELSGVTFPPPSSIPTMIVITEIPESSTIYETLTTWLNYGQIHHIPILVRKKDCESRDELFIQVITELIKRIDKKDIDY